MSEHSLFTHGTAVAIETPSNLDATIKLGWGTQITFKAPVPQKIGDLPDVFDVEGPGSWLHVPLTSMLTTGDFGRPNVRLKSVGILFAARHCRIQHVHVYDGVDIVQMFNDTNQKSEFPVLRTFDLGAPHRVSSAIGLSLFGCAFHADFDIRDPRFDGPFPSAELTIVAAGGQFVVDEPVSLAKIALEKLRAIAKI